MGFLKKLTLGLLLSSVFLMTGCQTTFKTTYNDNDSHALNLANAAGITGVKDAEVPKDSVSKMNNTVLDGALSGTVGFLSANTINLTDWTGGALGFMSAVFQPDHPSQRTAIFAFMPSDMAKDKNEAVQKMINIMKDTFQNSFDELGADDVTITYRPDIIKNALAFAYGGGNAINCPLGDDPDNPEKERVPMCRGSVVVQKPNQLLIEENKWLTNEPSVWYFSASKGHFYNKIEINARGYKAQTARLMALFSKHMPEWAYIYVAPKDTLDDNGDPINYPYVLNQGQAHLFVKAKAE